jgi:uncharacterized membrane protein
MPGLSPDPAALAADKRSDWLTLRPRAQPLVERVSPLPLAIRSFGLLFSEGASVGLFAWALSSSAVLPYATGNELPIQERQRLLAGMIGAGALAMLVGLAFLVFARTRGAERLSRTAVSLCPVLLIGLLPFLFSWRIWVTRELTFGVLITVFGFMLHATLSAATGAGASAASASASTSGLASALARVGRRWLERTQAWLPPLAVGLGAFAYTAYFSYYTVAHHRSVLTASFDLGLEDNLLWNLVNGGHFMKSTPPFGPSGVSHFGYHATLFAYVIAPIYYLRQNAETLLIFQSAAIGAAAIPLYLYARRHVGRWSACLLALAYLLYPPVHGSNLYDFHYLPLGVLFLWLTLWLVDAGHYKAAAVAVVLTLSIREDVAADLAVIGTFMIFASRRPRAGAVVAAVAGAYFLVMKMAIMPRFLHGAESFIHQWQELVPQGGRGYSGVLMTVLGNPVFTLTSMLEPEKFLYLVQIGAPLCFFAWRRPIGFLLSLPGFFFTLLSTNYLPLVQISFQYTAHWTAFLFPAVVVNLAWLRRPKTADDDRGFHRQRIWMATICVMTVIASFQYGAVLQQNTARGGFGDYTLGMSKQDHEKYRELQSLIRKVPPRAKIVASELVVPHVSNRPAAYTLRIGMFDADYLLFQLPARSDERSKASKALREDFGVIDVAGPFVLAKRGHPKTRNEAVVRQLK